MYASFTSHSIHLKICTAETVSGYRFFSFNFIDCEDL